MALDLTRRQWLGAAAAAGVAPRAFAQAVPAARGDGRLVVVFLRGALDGLSAFVPYADADYARARPSIALPAPDGSDQTALKLDGRFALHPALSPLLPLWQQGLLAVVPAAGSPDPTRSHFDAQLHWETARPGQTSDAPGWLNRLSALGGGDEAVHAIGVGESNPRILSGPRPVKLVARGKAAQRPGALENARTRDALLDMYGGDDALSKAFRQGAESRLQTAQDLKREMQAADNGAAPPALLTQNAHNLGTLMRQQRALRIGFLSAGGWDTHANQGAVTGPLANNLRTLAAALVQLRQDFNAMWLIGQRVAGGRWHGEWTGLAPANLNEQRDVPVHHDFRAVLAQVLRPGFGLGDSQLADALPGVRWDGRLDGLMRRG